MNLFRRTCRRRQSKGRLQVMSRRVKRRRSRPAWEVLCEETAQAYERIQHKEARRALEVYLKILDPKCKLTFGPAQPKSPGQDEAK